MSVHVGELTSEVVATGEAPATAAEVSMWEQRCRMASTVDRLARDQARTATGCEHDGHGHD
jgi:hypothetical protein